LLATPKSAKKKAREARNRAEARGSSDVSFLIAARRSKEWRGAVISRSANGNAEAALTMSQAQLL
jgi:hypothetical protein